MDGPTTPNERAAGDAGFIEHLRFLAASLSSYLGSRFELLGIESKEAFANYFKIVVLLVVALVVVIFGYVFFCVAAVFLIRHFTGIPWFWIMLGVGVLHFALAAVCAFLAKNRFALPMFAFTLTEFKKDKEWLRTPPQSIARES